MPRYFFDLIDGDIAVADETGDELDDLEAARCEAACVLGDRMRDAMPDGEHRSMSIEIRDRVMVALRVKLEMTVDKPVSSVGPTPRITNVTPRSIDGRRLK